MDNVQTFFGEVPRYLRGTMRSNGISIDSLGGCFAQELRQSSSVQDHNKSAATRTNQHRTEKMRKICPRRQDLFIGRQRSIIAQKFLQYINGRGQYGTAR